jgi:mono/diheme cytochrome c family protein
VLTSNLRLHSLGLALAVTGLLTACGGGGGGETPADIVPGQKAEPPTTGPNLFLLFPNPQKQADGTLETNTAAYTNAYYEAIDPNSERDTLTKYKQKNGFGSGTGQEITVIFGDQRDLGYGRRMTVRRNPDGTIAFFVENYLIQAGAGYQYSPANLEAAIVRDTKWLVGINAIEFTPGPNGGAPFPKFYNFIAGSEQRATFVDLDGRGGKAMPGPCISCHGGRGDALMPADATGKRKFNLVQNGVSLQRGDVQARLHPFEPDVFGFSTIAGFSRAEQEAKIKTINTWILCSYPLHGTSTAPEDQCRRPAGSSEWLAPQADLIKAAYGGSGLPRASWDDTYVPPGWETVGQSSLYREVVATSCRTCHSQRGTILQDDISFPTYAKFAAYSDRIKAHVIDRGNMPLAQIVYNAFYGNNRQESIGAFLTQQGMNVKDSSGATLKPGRPVADPGPSRVVKQGSSALSASNSLYATAYNWSIVSGPAGGATIASATSENTTFNATQNGTYVVRLTASSGSVQSTPVDITLVVDNAMAKAPTDIRFADIKAVLQSAEAGCTGSNCHSPGGTQSAPVFYTSYDRNGDGVQNSIDDDWFYAEVRGRVNFTEIAASPLLRKPSGNHHAGLLRPGFDTSAAPGQAARANFDLFQNWILNGAPK